MIVKEFWICQESVDRRERSNHPHHENQGVEFSRAEVESPTEMQCTSTT